MNRQSEFLRNEFWILSWNASVQRAVSYRKECAERERAEFRRFMIEYYIKQAKELYNEYKQRKKEAADRNRK